jgi:RimJ/RimL family protein N-acetyltransferase
LSAMVVELREVTVNDLPVLYEQQLDPQATAMAAFPSRDRAAFMAHWRRILGDAEVIVRVAVADGHVAGYVSCFDLDGETLVGYWIGREHWGRGIATAALASFVPLVDVRPLRARVASENAGSIRVLEKCGFVATGVATVGDDGVEELLYELG